MADGNSPNRLFLKKVLYRVDFQFITERMHEEVYSFIAEQYGQFFSEQSEELANEIDVEINAAYIEQPKVNRKSQPVFIFSHPKSDECDGRTLKLGRTFFYLELELTTSTMGIPYYDWIANIISFLSSYSIFRLTRVGLRKFNNFFILDASKHRLNDIFSIDYITGAPCEDFNLDQFSNRQIYVSDQYTLCFSRNYSSGQLSNDYLGISNELAHLVAFDFDLFTTADDNLAALKTNASDALLKMNSTILAFFNSIIREEIIAKLDTGEQLHEYEIIPGN